MPVGLRALRVQALKHLDVLGFRHLLALDSSNALLTALHRLRQRCDVLFELVKLRLQLNAPFAHRCGSVLSGLQAAGDFAHGRARILLRQLAVFVARIDLALSFGHDRSMPAQRREAGIRPTDV